MTSTTSDPHARHLVRAYREHVHPLLLEHNVPTLRASDQAARLVERLLERRRDLRIGVLGEAQVGKSSLINSLLGERALPAGGIGPLTAQATRIDYSKNSTIHVTYHRGDRLNQVALALRTYLRNRGEIPEHQDEQGTQPSELEVAVEAEVFAEGSADDLPRADQPHRTSKVAEHMLTQLKTMVVTDEGADVDRVTLLDCLHAVLSQAPVGDAAALEPFRERIAELKAKLGETETVTETSVGSRREFRRELRLRAAGWLSPLVKTLELELDIPLLKDARIVDLPGVGVLGDPSAQVAEEFVTTEGDALILVTRNTGITETLARVLEQAGVLTKLLFHGSDAADPIHLIVVITFLDNVAKERYATEVAKAQEFGDDLPDRHEIFRKTADEMTKWLRDQLRDALLASDDFTGLSNEHQETRRSAVQRLCETMDVVAVSAPDYMNLQSEATQDLAFLKRAESTGVPEITEALRALSRRATQAREAEIDRAASALLGTIEEQLSAIAGAYERSGGLTDDEWGRFRGDLESASVELKQKMAAFHGEALATLRKAIPKTIDLLCADAAETARRRLEKLAERAHELYWPSLNAALARSGTWSKKNLDFPGDLTRSLVDSVAADWEPRVVDEVRSAVKALAARDAKLVEALCQVASRHDAQIANDAHIRSQQKILVQQSSTCISWTRERLDKLRSNIQSELSGVVLEPIAKACTKAIAGKSNRGTGAKNRIVATFRAGSLDALAEARQAAARLLRRHYDQLVVELNETYLSEHHDPVQAALDALTNEDLERARKADGERKQEMLARIARVSSHIETVSESE